MSLREQGKQANRERILTSARQIIEEEGIENLSMRYLAEHAGVALRTPYNLLGSKARIFVLLLTELIEAMQAPLMEADADSGLRGLLSIPDAMEFGIGDREAYFRAVYWEVMSSEEREARDVGIAGLMSVTRPALLRAQELRELDAKADVDTLNRHLVLSALGLVGMWAADQLELDEMLAHFQRAWVEGLMAWCRPATRRWLQEYLSAD